MNKQINSRGVERITIKNTICVWEMEKKACYVLDNRKMALIKLPNFKMARNILED